MRNTTLIALRLTVITLVATGILYPLLVTGLAQTLMPSVANGSLVSDEKGRQVGSELLAQSFKGPAYFRPRPSAAGEKGYDPKASGGSNLGPTSKKLRERTVALLFELQKENPSAPARVPTELVTTSASGLDPHLSPAGARWQIPRIAAARQMDASRIQALVEAHVEGRDLGFLGEPRVNCLLLNLALDHQFGAPSNVPTAGEKEH